MNNSLNSRTSKIKFIYLKLSLLENIVKNMYYNIDDQMRFIVMYQDVTKSVATINHCTGIPKRTIRDWISKIEGEKIFWKSKKVEVEKSS